MQIWEKNTTQNILQGLTTGYNSSIIATEQVIQWELYDS